MRSESFAVNYIYQWLKNNYNQFLKMIKKLKENGYLKVEINMMEILKTIQQMDLASQFIKNRELFILVDLKMVHGMEKGLKN